MRAMPVALEHDPEKWNPVFRQDHAPLKRRELVPPRSTLLRHPARWTNGPIQAVVGAAVAATNAGNAVQPYSLGNVSLISAKQTSTQVKPMCHRVFSVALGLCLTVGLVAASAAPLAVPALAQNTEAKPADQAPANGQEPAKEPQKVDEFAEAQKALGGPAGNPECVWLGRRVVSLLWRDDLDTAFRHLDLYDRFGCPSGHIQATFRCLLLHSNNIDPKAADSLNGRVNSCWINPNLQATSPATAAPAAPAASVPSPTTNR
jgi:hypothetical protein